MAVKYWSNKKKVKTALKQATHRTLDAIGRQARSNVKFLAPVDTGALKDSINYHVEKESVLVGSTLTSEDYPVYQEKGTSKMSAQPYITPGIYLYLADYKKIAERNFRL